MDGRLAALYRHPVKGFTPEALAGATLQAGACFPCDRLYAVENGPCGYDPAAPVHVPKKKFAVLASMPALARVRTRYDEASGVIRVALDDRDAASFALTSEAGRDAFAEWLSGFVDPQDRRGALRVLEAAGPGRFMDDASAHVSLINLASLRDLGQRIGRTVDPLRFRANLHIDDWPPWAELDLEPGAEVRVGGATARVVKPIVRCAATHVDPRSGERDLDLVPALFQHYGRMTCGLYLQVEWGADVAVGDRVEGGAALRAPPMAPERAPVHAR